MPQASLAERVLRFIRRRRIVPPGARVLVGLSGGRDSVALAFLLRELSNAGHLSLIGLAHVHHGLRGAEADRDEAFCRAVAERLGVPLDVTRVDVASEAAAAGISLETAARHARYSALDAAADRLGADVIAVGHTLDDQAETVVMRLARGCGARGLAGIRPRRGRIVRPLLDVRRADVTEWLASHGLDHVEDSSNADVGLFRNRVRHRVLPALHEALGVDPAVRLARHAELARADDELLEALATAAAPRVLTLGTQTAEILGEALLAEPLALRRRLLYRALDAVRGPGRVSLEVVDAVLEAVEAGAVPPAIAGMRLELRRAGGVLVISAAGLGRGSPGFAYPLPVPGSLRVPEIDGWLRADVGTRDDAREALKGSGRPDRVVVAGESLGAGLLVRSWRPGDRFRPLGMDGRKKVQDLFVDRKVPRDARRGVPLVIDGSGRIVWVAGHALAEEFRVTSDAKSVVVLSFEQSGGPV